MTTLPDTQALVAEIQTWVQCESPSHYVEGITAMAQLAAERARALGMRVELTPLGADVGPMVYATTRAPGDTRPGILIIGHIDTVHPVGTLGENPCRIEDDRLYGPGSYDMKAGIVLALAGLTGLTAPGATRLPIDFLMVPDEETGSHASREHIEHLAKQAKYGLVCEPARPNGGKCVTARKGTGMLR
ncbi:M20/M25/M40 family metallo-hydrolase, partial [Bordetella hinzii]|nr:M20/M25/M40 family metallo-hydrolase [Bordetella hinzii]